MNNQIFYSLVRYESFIYCRKFHDYDRQLEYVRVEREKLQAELDECRKEIIHLTNILRSYEDRTVYVQVSLTKFIR